MANNNNGENTEIKEFLYKIIVIGDIGVGKTSLIKRYVHNIFSYTYKATIGVDFALKSFNYDDKTIVRLQLWDIAGQERFGNMTRVYYKEAMAAVIVCDITRNGTIETVQKWLYDIKEKIKLSDDSDIPIVIAINKCDLCDSEKIKEDTAQYFKSVYKNAIDNTFLISVKENKNIDDMFKFVTKKILDVDPQNKHLDDTIIKIANTVSNKKTCC